MHKVPLGTIRREFAQQLHAIPGLPLEEVWRRFGIKLATNLSRVFADVPFKVTVAQTAIGDLEIYAEVGEGVTVPPNIQRLCAGLLDS